MQIQKVITVAQAERFCDAYDSIKPSFGKRKHPSVIYKTFDPPLSSFCQVLVGDQF